MDCEACERIIRSKLNRELQVSVAWPGRYDDGRPSEHYEQERKVGRTFPYDKTRESIYDETNLVAEEIERLKTFTNRIDEHVIIAAQRIRERYCPKNKIKEAEQIRREVFERVASSIEREFSRDLVILAPDPWLPVL